MQRGSASPPVGLLQSLPGPGDNHHDDNDHDYDNGDHDFDDDDVDVSFQGPGDRYQRTPTVTIALNSDYYHQHGPYCHHCHHHLLHDHDNNHHCHDPQTTPAPTIAPEAGVRGDEAVAGPR